MQLGRRVVTSTVATLGVVFAAGGCVPGEKPLYAPPEEPATRADGGPRTDSDSDGDPDPAPTDDSSVPDSDDASETPATCADAELPQDGRLLWLRADMGVTLDGDRVTRWENGGSADNAFTPGTAPRRIDDALNGQPVVRFENGATLGSSIGVNGLQEMSMVMVTATRQYQAPGPEWCNDDFGMAITENGCSGTYNLPILWQENGSWGFVYVGPVQEQIAYRFGPGSKTYSSNLEELEYDPQVAWRRPASIGDAYTYTLATKTDTDIALFVDFDNVMDTPIPGGAGPIENASDQVDLGSGRRDDLRWTGDIAEIVAYDRALDESDRALVDAYVECRYFP